MLKIVLCSSFLLNLSHIAYAFNPACKCTTKIFFYYILFKKSPSLINNYRPTSALSFYSKVFENSCIINCIILLRQMTFYMLINVDFVVDIYSTNHYLSYRSSNKSN